MTTMDIKHSENLSAIFVADDDNSRPGKDGSEGPRLSINASEYSFLTRLTGVVAHPV